MADKVATTMAYTASGGAIVFGLTANEFAAYTGATVAVLTYFTNLWFKHQHLKLARKKAALAQEEEEGDG